MKTLFLMSWRNLWRNKRRSFTVLSSIGVGVMGMIFSAGFMNGMNGQMVENTINTSIGHMAIHEAGFQDNMKIEYRFADNAGIEKKLPSLPGYLAHAPRVKIFGMARSSEAARGVMIVGIDPEKEKKVSGIYSYIIRDGTGSYLQSVSSNEVLVSVSLAQRLDLVTGDRLVVMIQDSHGEISAAALAIRGLFRTPMETFDKYTIFTGIDTLRTIAGIGNDLSEITILLDDREKAGRAKKHLASSLGRPDLEILSWKDMAPDLVSAIKLYDSMMYIFFLIVFVTVIFTVANTLIMAIMERFHELGVMKSLGTRPSWIFSLVMLEALNLGAAGLAAGTVTGALVISLFSTTGIDLSMFAASMRMFGTGNVIYPYVKKMDIVASVGIVFLTTVIAALYPSVKAARIKPLDALNYL